MNSNKLPHLFFENTIDLKGKYKVPPRWNPNTNKDNSSANYEEEATNMDPTNLDLEAKVPIIRESLDHFNNKRRNKNSKRNQQIFKVKYELLYLIVEFRDFFYADENYFRENYGLIPIKYENFNKKILFHIEKQSKFGLLQGELNLFIQNFSRVKKGHFAFNFISNIIRFDLLSPEEVINNFNPELVILQLVNTIEIDSSNIVEELKQYLTNKSINYEYNPFLETLEIYKINTDVINTIVDNFDIILSANGIPPLTISPSSLSLPERKANFVIELNDNPSIIGIIDSGISKNTPLYNITIHDESYNLTNTSPLLDEYSHGTSVALLASIGSQYIESPKSKYLADAQLLSIKAISLNNNTVSRLKLIELIKTAHYEYKIQLFTLTLTSEVLKNNCTISDYAHALDKLSHDLGILIIMSAGNASDYFNPDTQDLFSYPEQFLREDRNIQSPADSLNNLSIGALADNFRAELVPGALTPNKKYPAIYTTKYNFDMSTSGLKVNQKNKYRRKPDIIFNGGDQSTDGPCEHSALMVLRSKLGLRGNFNYKEGTSYSAPLVANIAAKIMRKYPRLSMQTVKALIINSSENPWGSKKIPNELNGINIEHVQGYGSPRIDYCLESSKDRITLIFEDKILPNTHKLIPFQIPRYLETLNHKKGVLSVTITLCYSFEPIANNHLAYCPIHITFGIFQETEISGKKMTEVNITNNVNWCEDYYYKSKLLSNVQKKQFNIQKSKLISEEGQLQLAVKSIIHKTLEKSPDYAKYNREHKFSLVIQIEEISLKGQTSGYLYNEMIKLNNLADASGTLDLDIDI